MTVINVLFFVRYPIPDQFTFIIPSLIMVAIGAGVGISVLFDYAKHWHTAAITVCMLSIALPPVAYATIPSLLKKYGVAVKRSRELPYRDELRYWIVPWKHNERSAELFARTALREAGPSGTIVCDGTSYYPLKIIQMQEKLSPGVAVRNAGEIKRLFSRGEDTERRELRARGLYVISPALDFLPEEVMRSVTLNREPGRILYRVVWNKD